jgi:hypothetical protein
MADKDIKSEITPIERKIAESAGITPEELLIAEKLGVTPEEFSAAKPTKWSQGEARRGQK